MFMRQIAGVLDDEEMGLLLQANYDLAEFIRDRLVPRAVLFFTGEAMDDNSDEEESLVSGELMSG